MGIFNNPARDEQGNELRRRRTDQIPFSIIASDMTVVGDLETEGVVRIEGRVRGTVRVGSQVLVVIPPKDGFAAGSAPSGVAPDSTVIMVIDVLGIA